MKIGTFGSYFVEFTYPTYGRNDSKICLENDNCLPVGGYSVWTTSQSYNANKTSKNKLIFAITSMHTICLFHQNICRSGNSNIAGEVSWLPSNYPTKSRMILYITFDISNITTYT